MMQRWLVELATKGFTLRRGVVPLKLVEAARTLIEQQLVSDLSGADHNRIAAWTNRSFVPTIETDPRLLALYQQSPLAVMVRRALAPHNLRPLERAQVQIRLSRRRPGALSQPVKDWHCDGIACPHLPPGQLNTFQLLVGVLLTDIPSACGGAVNFRTGGHASVAEAFQKNRPFANRRQVPTSVLELPIEEMCGSAGDAILSHHMAPHAVGNNETETDRIMAYFRLRVDDHDSIARYQLTDPWIRMPTLKTMAGGAAWPRSE